MGTTPLVSVVIPTLDRPRELRECLRALEAQTSREFEILTLTERRPLAAIRNQGVRRARGLYVAFIDDDVVPTPTWVSDVLAAFRASGAVGVSGPCPIPAAHRQQRDLFRYQRLKRLYDTLFLDGAAHLPGHLTHAGAFTTGAAFEDCRYEGPVDFLEACHMVFRKEALEAVGGFDEAYRGIGDWSEPDLCCRLRQRYGDECLLFLQRVRVVHKPSRTGAYLLRRHVGARLANYALFARRWVRPSLRHALYWGWLLAYYGYKEACTLLPSRWRPF